jgi:hypothetical protein
LQPGPQPALHEQGLRGRCPIGREDIGEVGEPLEDLDGINRKTLDFGDDLDGVVTRYQTEYGLALEFVRERELFPIFDNHKSAAIRCLASPGTTFALTGEMAPAESPTAQSSRSHCSEGPESRIPLASVIDTARYWRITCRKRERSRNVFTNLCGRR